MRVPANQDPLIDCRPAQQKAFKGMWGAFFRVRAGDRREAPHL
jgi:hypothetical protein